VRRFANWFAIASERAKKRTHTRKGGRLYRYYIAADVLKHDAAECTVRRAPAAEIEGAVVGCEPKGCPT
jgi:hypothetical protein